MPLLQYVKQALDSHKLSQSKASEATEHVTEPETVSLFLIRNLEPHGMSEGQIYHLPMYGVYKANFETTIPPQEHDMQCQGLNRR